MTRRHVGLHTPDTDHHHAPAPATAGRRRRQLRRQIAADIALGVVTAPILGLAIVHGYDFTAAALAFVELSSLTALAVDSGQLRSMR